MIDRLGPRALLAMSGRPPRSQPRRLPLTAALLAMASGLAALAPARADEARITYDLSLAGLPLGQATLAATLDGDRYKIDVTAKLAGLAAMVTSGRGAATATGLVAAPRVTPSGYVLSSSNGSETRTVRFTTPNGVAQSIEIVPPLDEKSDRVPITDGHRRGIVDPVSALLMPVPAVTPAAAGPAREAAACDRTIPVFDGATRFDVRLSFAGTREARTPGFTGPVVVCKARYVPIAGHRPARRATQFMADNKDMEAWLAPIGQTASGTRVYAPVRIAVRTLVGQTIIQASNVQVDGAKRADAR